MSVFSTAPFGRLSLARLLLATGIAAAAVLLVMMAFFPRKCVYTVGDHLRGKVAGVKSDAKYVREETDLVEFLADALLREKRNDDALHLAHVLNQGPVLDMASTPERKARTKALFSGLRESGRLDDAFVAYLFCFDWFRAEKTGICDRRETEEAVDGFFGAFESGKPQDAVSVGLASLRKLKDKNGNVGEKIGRHE